MVHHADNPYGRSTFATSACRDMRQPRIYWRRKLTVSDNVSANKGLAKAARATRTRAGRSASGHSAITPLQPVDAGQDIVPSHKKMRKRSRANIDDLSSSLRQAYQSTLEESIPDSIMDLLRKLD
jgi:Anti-sigma factor NepR